MRPLPVVAGYVVAAAAAVVMKQPVVAVVDDDDVAAAVPVGVAVAVVVDRLDFCIRALKNTWFSFSTIIPTFH